MTALSVSSAAWPADWEPLARLLLRTEGIASSSFEGVQAPLVAVAVAEVASGEGEAGWIADNVATVTEAIEADELTIALMHQWHRRLMGHSGLDPAMISAWRPAPSWIGGTSPLDAAYVPPPADAVPELMDDLVTFANSNRFDAVTQAALLHAQFETIHPYGDGNGRLGRILIGWLLRRRGAVDRLPPPISVLIARDPGGYLSGLFMFREGSVGSWVRWFADVASSAARHSDAMLDDASALLHEWSKRVADLRFDAAARRLAPLLPQVPVLNAQLGAQLLDVSERTARDALAQLVERGLLERVDVSTPGRGRPTQWYAASGLLDATRRWAG